MIFIVKQTATTIEDGVGGGGRRSHRRRRIGRKQWHSVRKNRETALQFA